METELQIVRSVLVRVPTKYHNPDNEKALALACAAENKPVTVLNVIDAYSRLRDSGQLVENAPENHAPETVKEFLYPILRYRDVAANEQMLIAASAAPVTLESVREAFSRIKHQLATNNDYAEAYRTFFQKYPEYAVEANMAVLDDLHHGEDITAQTLEELLENPNVIRQLAVTAEASNQQADEHELNAIIAEIVGNLKTQIDGRGRKLCTDASGRHLVDYKTEVERIQSLGLEDLRALLADRTERRRLRSLSKEELHQVVKSNSSAWPSRYEPIPSQYIVPGKDIGINWSFQLLKRLPTPEQKRLLRIFGEAQINAACAAGRN